MATREELEKLIADLAQRYEREALRIRSNTMYPAFCLNAQAESAEEFARELRNLLGAETRWARCRPTGT